MFSYMYSDWLLSYPKGKNTSCGAHASKYSCSFLGKEGPRNVKHLIPTNTDFGMKGAVPLLPSIPL